MRIISGEWRGRKLRAPRGRGVRPTPDRVREALFSILGPDPLAGDVLDLFAGTGALGLEALSRGAPAATFVEHHRDSLRLLRDNVETLGAESRVRIVARSAFSMRLGLPETPSCSLVLADPPYAMLEDRASRGRIAALLGRLASGDHLREGAVVVLEHHRTVRGPDIGGLRRADHREYGETALTIYEIHRS